MKLALLSSAVFQNILNTRNFSSVNLPSPHVVSIMKFHSATLCLPICKPSGRIPVCENKVLAKRPAKINSVILFMIVWVGN